METLIVYDDKLYGTRSPLHNIYFATYSVTGTTFYISVPKWIPEDIGGNPTYIT